MKHIAFTAIFAILLAYDAMAGSDYSFLRNIIDGQNRMMMHKWTVENGLPVNATYNTVYAIDGFMWLSTHDGLVRFDGYEFDVFNTVNTPGFKGNRILNLRKGTDGTFWFATSSGYLANFRDNQFEWYRISDGPDNEYTHNLLFDNENRLWIATTGGLYYLKDGVITTFEKHDQSESIGYTTMHQHSDGSIIAAASERILIIKGDSVTHHRIRDHFQYHWLANITELHDGRVLMGTPDGPMQIYPGEPRLLYTNTEIGGKPATEIIQKDDGTIIISSTLGILTDREGQVRYHLLPAPAPEAIPEDARYIREVFKDSKGVVWLISRTHHVYNYKNNELKPAPFFEELRDARVINMTEDQDGQFWFNAYLGGLIRLSQREVFMLDSSDGLTDNNIVSVLERRNGDIWIGSLSHDVTKFESGRPPVQLNPGAERQSVVHTLAESPDERVFIGYFGIGYSIYENGKMVAKFIDADKGARNTVNAFYFENDGSYWLGTYGGIIHKRPDGSEKVISSEDGLPHNWVRYITRCPRGLLWIGTYNGGVASFDGEQFTVFNTANGLSSNKIRAIYPDPELDGHIWIGTEDHGLSLITDKGVRIINKNHGLFDNVVHKIIEDDDRRLWMSSNRGIFYLHKDDLLQLVNKQVSSVTSFSFTQSQGMNNSEANGGNMSAGMRTRDGLLVFATQAGAAIVDPAKITSEIRQPKTQIKKITAENEFFNSQNPIRFEAGTRNISFDFSGIHFTRPELVRYSYRLTPIDSRFNDIGSRRSAYFTNLSPGTYTFEVQSKIGAGGSEASTATLTFTIKPYFWETPLFWILSAGLLSFMVVYSIRYRIKTLERNREKLEQMVEERTQELREQTEKALEQNNIILEQANELRELNASKDKFFSIIAHDLKGSFLGIVGISEVLEEEYDLLDDETRLLYIQKMHESSSKVYQLLENLLSWASLQRGTLKPELTRINVCDILARNVELNQERATEKGIEIVSEFPLSEGCFAEADADMIDLIIRNLLSNALKFSRDGDVIRINARYAAQKKLEVIISDTGIGMSPEIVQNLFKPEEKTTRTGTANESGTGIGLPLCLELTKAMNGTIQVQSTVNAGTIFTVTLNAANPE